MIQHISHLTSEKNKKQNTILIQYYSILFNTIPLNVNTA